MKGMTSSGLELLHIVLFKTKDHMQLVLTMQEKLGGWCFLERILSDSHQFVWRLEHPLDRDQEHIQRDRKQQQRDPLPFEGDKADAPPLAWTLIWQGTYSNLYGEYVPDVIRRWGYIMWDSWRLEETGAKEVLACQWETIPDWDPRDQYDDDF